MANEMRGKHLVTDNPQNMTESMLNFAYAKNERVYLSYADGTEDIDLCEYVSQLTKKQGCNLSADDVMQGSCIEGCDCEVAILYTLAVQAAELRERLKHYESLEEQGLLQTLPCKVGDTVYWLLDGKANECTVYCISQEFFDGEITLRLHIRGKWCDEIDLQPIYPFPDPVLFFDKEQAEQKLKEMRGGNADTT